jgi:branched-chain amino acid transport system permease protein
VALALRNILTLVFSPDVQAIRPSYAATHFAIHGVIVDVPHLLAFAASLVLLGVLALVLDRTPLGRMIRATAQQPLAARLCGIDVEHVFGLTFGLAAAFAGAAGVIVGMLFPFTPTTEAYWTLYAFVVVVLGGAGSPAGALLGGLLLGLVSSFTVRLIGPAFPNAMVFVVLVLMLLVRPNGLLGNAFGASR